MAASQEQDFGTANLHMEVSDIISVLVYVGVAKGNGVLSKTGKPGAACHTAVNSLSVYLVSSVREREGGGKPSARAEMFHKPLSSEEKNTEHGFHPGNNEMLEMHLEGFFSASTGP